MLINIKEVFQILFFVGLRGLQLHAEVILQTRYQLIMADPCMTEARLVIAKKKDFLSPQSSLPVASWLLRGAPWRGAAARRRLQGRGKRILKIDFQILPGLAFRMFNFSILLMLKLVPLPNDFQWALEANRASGNESWTYCMTCKIPMTRNPGLSRSVFPHAES